MKTPAAVGVPLIVIALEAQLAITPDGSPTGVPIPVAPVVACVIFVSAVLTQSVGDEEAAPTVLFARTVMVPEAFTLPQPPVSGIE